VRFRHLGVSVGSVNISALESIMKKQITVIALLMLLTGGSASAATPFNSLVVFGDSLSDAGDNPSAVTSLYKILGGHCDVLFHPCPPYDDGRISNGPIAAEYLAGSLFPGAVSATNYRSYAVAGATSGSDNSGNDIIFGILDLPGIKEEVDHYMTDTGGTADPKALYMVWGGGNDYLTHDSPVQAAQNIGSYVNTLAAAGAMNFLVPNLPDLGLTPSARNEGEVTQAHGYSVVFNTELANQLGNLDTAFPAANIYRFDTYTLLNDIVQNPGNYGFTDVTTPCFTLLGLTCDNPEGHLYWDDFHPTTNAHAILGAAFTSAVPEPSAVVMFIIGLLVLVWIANIRQKSVYAWQRR
jgi:phospholipase/lecithinase/hemolysin